MSKPSCNATGCERQSKTSGLCGMHYQRFLKHGDQEKRKSRANGEGGVSTQGYVIISVNGRRVAEHILICEKAIGKKLPDGAEVHHVNEIKTDNRKTNLVICPSSGYHQLLHARQNALDKCGNPDFRQCRYCNVFDDVSNLYISKGNQKGHHRKCRQEARKNVNRTG